MKSPILISGKRVDIKALRLGGQGNVKEKNERIK